MITSLERIQQSLQGFWPGTQVVKAIVFGSYADATQDEWSDIDLFLIARTGKRFLDRFEDYNEVYRALHDFTVDLIVYTPEEVELYKNRPFIEKILKYGSVIYERD